MVRKVVALSVSRVSPFVPVVCKNSADSTRLGSDLLS